MKGTIQRAGLAAVALAATCGCVALRGRDFGHWAGLGESTPLVRITQQTGPVPLTGQEQVLLLPITGNLPSEAARTLQNYLYREACTYFPVNVQSLPAGCPAAEYASQDNLLKANALFNVREVGRLGAFFGASHVLSVHVREFRPYHPQVLALRLTLIDVASGRVALDMDAAFDATQQSVVMALAAHLQERRARKYDTQNLDLMLRSPSEYAAFVSACCCRGIAKTVWMKAPGKETAEQNDEMRMGRP
jgi:hypothetical protein